MNHAANLAVLGDLGICAAYLVLTVYCWLAVSSQQRGLRFMFSLLIFLCAVQYFDAAIADASGSCGIGSMPLGLAKLVTAVTYGSTALFASWLLASGSLRAKAAAVRPWLCVSIWPRPEPK